MKFWHLLFQNREMKAGAAKNFTVTGYFLYKLVKIKSFPNMQQVSSESNNPVQISGSKEVSSIRIVQSCGCGYPKLYVRYKGQTQYIPLKICREAIPTLQQVRDAGRAITTGGSDFNNAHLYLRSISNINTTTAFYVNEGGGNIQVADNNGYSNLNLQPLGGTTTLGTGNSFGIFGGTNILLSSSITEIDATNNTSGFGTPTKQLKVGTLLDFTEYLSFVKGATIQITQNHLSNGNNATYIGMTSPSASQPNGISICGYGSGGSRLVPYVRSLSNQSITTLPSTTWDVGFGYNVQLYENATTLNMGFVIGIQRNKDISRINFSSTELLKNDTTHLFNIQEGIGVDTPAINPANWRFWIRRNGDLHTSGTLYTPLNLVSGSTTIALTVHKYIHTGAAITMTLPNPTNNDNKNREHIIVNHGTGDITLSEPITIGNGTTINILSPGAALIIACDGTVWRSIIPAVSNLKASFDVPATEQKANSVSMIGTLNIAGVQSTDFVEISQAVDSNIQYVARATGRDTITVYRKNYTSIDITPTAETLIVRVLK